MNFKDFAAKMRDDVARQLGENYTVTLKNITKNNGVTPQGMLIHGEHNVTPTIYLEALWERYEQGESWDILLEKVLSIYKNNVPKVPLDMEFYKDFEQVKKRIIYKLINADQNERLLNDIPHISFLDLAICFCYAFTHEKLGDGTILIRNVHMDSWNTKTAELFRHAQKNTRKLYGLELSPMEDVLRRLMEREYPKILAAGEELFEDPIPMKVLTNCRHQFGAAAMIYPGVLKSVAEEYDRSLYILPSSLHEVILLPDTGEEDPTLLKQMVEEVNQTHLPPEDQLSTHIYYYDKTTQEVTIAA